MKPLISIITPSFNSESTIGDTLQSVSSQSYTNVEHIIIDGASRDRTLDVVAKFAHVAKMQSERDAGIYDAMNKGISLATGDIIGVLNSDDFYASNSVLEKVAEIFGDADVQAVYGDLVYVDQFDIDKTVRYWRSGGYDSQKFYYGWMPPHPTFFVRRELYEQCGIFNTSFRSSADYELMLRFLVRFNVQATYLPEVLVKMRTGGASNASFKNRWRANREDRRAWDVNGLTPYFFTIPLKPFRKITQYLIK